MYNTTAVPGTWVNVGTNSNSYTVPSPSGSFVLIVVRRLRAVATQFLTVNKATPTTTLAISNSPQTWCIGQAAVTISASSVPGAVSTS
jgi:hypothetical protein